MAVQQRDRREGVVEEGREQRVEAVGVGGGHVVGLVEVEARAEEFGAGAADDHGAGSVVCADEGGLDVPEGGDDGLREEGGDAVFGRFIERDDVDVEGVGGGGGVDCEV